ncbi:MAG: hypothetical protein ACXVQJ_08325 [Actinomycetota bacterium]
MVRRSRPLLVLLALAALLAPACTGSSATTSPSLQPTGSGATSATPSRPDPLVPYSPSPTPFQERTNGFLHETLTLPTSDGQKIRVTLDSTAIDMTYVDGTRATSVWLTVQNPGDQPWTGAPGAKTTITDELGGTFLPVRHPTAAQLYPKPERYGHSNRNLTQKLTIQPGQQVQGVVVFVPTGGNRAANLNISLDAGATWGYWVMNMGPY